MTETLDPAATSAPTTGHRELAARKRAANRAGFFDLLPPDLRNVLDYSAIRIAALKDDFDATMVRTDPNQARELVDFLGSSLPLRQLARQNLTARATLSAPGADDVADFGMELLLSPDAAKALQGSARARAVISQAVADARAARRANGGPRPGAATLRSSRAVKRTGSPSCVKARPGTGRKPNVREAEAAELRARLAEVEESRQRPSNCSTPRASR